MLENWMENPSNIIIVVIAVFVLLLIMWNIRLGRKLNRLRKQYTAVMGNTGLDNLEDVIIEIKQEQFDQATQAEQLRNQIHAIEKILPKQKSKLGVIRYNAFDDTGSDLSFSIAIINDEQDGAVFTGIHSRNYSHVYAKPIAKGESKYALTPEERKAIQIAD